MSEQQEVWKAVPGYEGVYEVSDQGRVRRIGRAKGAQVGKILSPTIRGHGYCTIILHKNRREATWYVHRLVLLSFLGEDSQRPEVNHKNGNRADNRLCNLEWMSRSENELHAIRVLRSFSPGAGKGEANHQSKLTEDDVRQIRELYATGLYSHNKLAAMFGVTKSPIKLIIDRKAWKHVA